MAGFAPHDMSFHNASGQNMDSEPDVIFAGDLLVKTEAEDDDFTVDPFLQQLLSVGIPAAISDFGEHYGGGKQRRTLAMADVHSNDELSYSSRSELSESEGSSSPGSSPIPSPPKASPYDDYNYDADNAPIALATTTVARGYRSDRAAVSIDELHREMGWNALDIAPAKRKRESKSKEARQQKHVLSEQKRRDSMNEAIETLKDILPGEMDKKATKVAVLKQSAAYLKNLREYSCRLISENRRINAENERLLAIIHQQKVTTPAKSGADNNNHSSSPHHHHQQNLTDVVDEEDDLNTVGSNQPTITTASVTDNRTNNNNNSFVDNYEFVQRQHTVDSNNNNNTFNILNSTTINDDLDVDNDTTTTTTTPTNIDPAQLFLESQFLSTTTSPSPYLSPSSSSNSSNFSSSFDPIPLSPIPLASLSSPAAPASGVACNDDRVYLQPIGSYPRHVGGDPTLAGDDGDIRHPRHIQQQQQTEHVMIPADDVDADDVIVTRTSLSQLHRRPITNASSPADISHYYNPSHSSSSSLPPSPIPLVAASPRSTDYLFNQGGRMLFLVLFFVFVFYKPTEYLESIGATSFAGRVLQSEDGASEFSPVSYISGLATGWLGPLLSLWLWVTVLKWLVIAFVTYAVMISWNTRRNCDQFQAARKAQRRSDLWSKRGNMRQAEKEFAASLAFLGRGVPSDTGGILPVAMVMWEVARHVLHTVWIGLIVERLLIAMRNDRPEAVTEGQGLAGFVRSHDAVDTRWTYAALAGLNVARATGDLALQAEISVSICLRLQGKPGPWWRLLCCYARRTYKRAAKGSSDTSDAMAIVYYGEAINAMCAGKLEEANELLSKALELYDRESVRTRNARVYEALLHSLSGRYQKAMNVYSQVLRASIKHQDINSVCWCLMGTVHCMLSVNKPRAAMKVLMALDQFPWDNIMIADKLLYKTLMCAALYKIGRHRDALKIAEELIDGPLKESVCYHARYYSFLMHQLLTETVLSLLQESLKESSNNKSSNPSSSASSSSPSSLAVHAVKLERLAQQALLSLEKFSDCFPVNKPCALRCQGVYHFVLGGAGFCARAKKYWDSALSNAVAMGMRPEELAVRQLLDAHAMQLMEGSVAQQQTAVDV